VRVTFVRVPEIVTEFIVRLGQDSGLFKVLFRQVYVEEELHCLLFMLSRFTRFYFIPIINTEHVC